MRPRILDFDGSVAPLNGCDVVPLRAFEETIRFGCTIATLRSIGSAIERLDEAADHEAPAVTFLGSGDFHHVSYLLIEGLRAAAESLQVVVFDNHPDNMRYAFGVHCGSWVSHVARLPFVSRVHVAGICSPDVERLHAFENRLAPLRSGKVRYWCVGRDLRFLEALGARACRSFTTTEAMLEALLMEVTAADDRVYLSIDKDVLAQNVVQTNWDQGQMTFDQLASAVTALRESVLAADITGDVSVYRYRSAFKRFLSRLDGQPVIAAASIDRARRAHRAVNEALLSRLGGDRGATHQR